jgi:PqqD family protein of HPr-rel-A system
LEGVGFLEKNWGDDYLVWSELTGQTHLLDLLSATVLRLLQQAPTAANELAERVAQTLKLESDNLLTVVEQTLADFERLGLAEQNRL